MQGEEQSPGYGEKHQPWDQLQLPLLLVTLTKYLTPDHSPKSLIIDETCDKVHPSQPRSLWPRGLSVKWV